MLRQPSARLLVTLALCEVWETTNQIVTTSAESRGSFMLMFFRFAGLRLHLAWLLIVKLWNIVTINVFHLAVDIWTSKRLD
jgi:hypothetical protein